MTTLPSEAALRVFQQARNSILSMMEPWEDSGNSWDEEQVTGLLLSSLAPIVKFAPFVKREEKKTGADWLWWWIDDKGESFGMLVQAKRLHKRNGGWEFGFRYDEGNQRRRLFETADYFKIPPVYALYLGSPKFRQGAFCPNRPHVMPCLRCQQSTISMVAALLPNQGGGSPRDEATFAMMNALPLEWIADPAISEPIIDRNIDVVGGELREFLLEPQTNARRVANRMFQAVAATRMLQYSGSTGSLTRTESDCVLTEYPEDYGHFSMNYFEHILRGLKTSPPDYVLDVLADSPVRDSVRERVDGIAIFAC